MRPSELYMQVRGDELSDKGCPCGYVYTVADNKYHMRCPVCGKDWREYIKVKKEN
jgi:predicted Zn-ribbon and HTH transcriptional regulator